MNWKDLMKAIAFAIPLLALMFASTQAQPTMILDCSDVDSLYVSPDPVAPDSLKSYQSEFAGTNDIDYIIPCGIFMVDPVANNYDINVVRAFVANFFRQVEEKIVGRKYKFHLALVDDIESNDMEQTHLAYRDQMVTIFIRPTMGACGNSLYNVCVKYSCIKDDIVGNIIIHELGHETGLTHTFWPDNDTSLRNIWTAEGPDHSIVDYDFECPCPLTELAHYSVGHEDECLYRGDNVCETVAEVNPAANIFDTNDIQWYVLKSDNTTVPGSSIYVPDYTKLQSWYANDDLTWQAISYQRDNDGNPIPLDPCSLAAVGLKDCNGYPYDDVYAENGYYNVMTYPGPGCDTKFEEQQVEIMHNNISSGAIAHFCNYNNNLVVYAGGDIDGLINTFSSLEDAFAFIENDKYLSYTIYIVMQQNAYEFDGYKLDGKKYTNEDSYSGFVDDDFGRELRIKIVGVDSVNMDGSNPIFAYDYVDISGDQDPLYIGGRVELTLMNMQFSGFSNGEVFGIDDSYAMVLDFRGRSLWIDNCSFVNNGINTSLYTTNDVCEGVISYAPQGTPSLHLENCLFADNESPGGNAVAFNMKSISNSYTNFAQVLNTTFANNSYTPGSSNVNALHARFENDIVVRNCIFAGSDPNNGTPGNQCPITVEYGLPTNMLSEIDYCLFDQDNWLSTHLQELNSTNTVISHSMSAGFVNENENDYRLRWDSICREKGDPSEIDYDGTISDVGSYTRYPEIEISGTVTITERGNYKLSGATTITGIGVNDVDAVIPEGTTIRDDYAYGLIIRDTNSTNGYHIAIGDPDGARTAIVSTANVFIGSITAGQVADARFDGLVFNRPSVDGGSLWISNCNLEMDGANGNVKFSNYGQTEVVFNEVCRGQFKNFNFQHEQVAGGGAGILCIDVQYSDMDVLNVTFDPVTSGDNPWYWKLLHYGTVTGNPTHVIANCTFPSQDNGLGVFPALLCNATLNLHHNLFNDIQVGAISLGSATLNMKNGAANTFDKPYNLEYIGSPIIDGYLTNSDLTCGYNAFLYDNIRQGDQYIVSTCESTDWSYNYWGENCQTAVNPVGHIPQCANTTPCLAVCPTVFTPCEGQDDEDSELYALGCAADSLYNYEAALAYWFQLLTEVPDSKYCTEVTSSIKAIGLLTEHGAEAYGAIRSDLEAAAVESEPVDTLLSVYQVCRAWCVEGRHGDREAAVALLDSLYEEKKSNEDMATLISTALAEIDTYSPQGQNSAINPEAEIAQLVHRQERLHNLYRVLLPAMTAQSHAVLEQPSTQVAARFGITSCYPNPFNPVTTIEVEVREGEPLRLEVFNMKGQRVAVLHDGPATSLQRYQWNAGALSSGLYLVRAQQGLHSDVSKVILFR
jgi:hypothetical protein